MGKYRVQHTPEQKKQYWMERIVKSANTSYRQFSTDINVIADWATHAGLTDEERNRLAMMLAQQFSIVLKRLAPPQKESDGQPAIELPTEPEVPADK